MDAYIVPFPFGWTMLNVGVMNKPLQHAGTMDGMFMTVTITRTQGLFVKMTQFHPLKVNS